MEKGVKNQLFLFFGIVLFALLLNNDFSTGKVVLNPVYSRLDQSCFKLPSQGITLDKNNFSYHICPGDYTQNGPIIILANNVKIKCFGLVNLKQGSNNINSIEIYGANAEVDHCNIQGFKNGIYLQGQDASIINNTLTDNENGIKIYGGTTWPYVEANRFGISNNIITQNENGINIEQLGYTDDVAKYKGYILENTLANNNENGIKMYSVASYIDIKNNTLSWNGKDGVSLIRTSNTPHIRFNEIESNALHGIEYVDSYDWNVFKNFIANNGVDGVHLEKIDGYAIAHLTSNTIFNNGVNGIFAETKKQQAVSYYSLDVEAFCNAISAHPDSGIKILANPLILLNTPVTAQIWNNNINANNNGIYLDIQASVTGTFTVISNIIRHGNIGIDAKQGGSKTFYLNEFIDNPNANAFDLASQPTDYWDGSAKSYPGNWWGGVTGIYDVPPLVNPFNVDYYPLLAMPYAENLDVTANCQDTAPPEEPAAPFCGDGYVNGGEQCETDVQCPAGKTCQNCKCKGPVIGGGGSSSTGGVFPPPPS